MAALSKIQKLLIAAGSLTAQGNTRFSAEDLSVHAFEQFPKDFAMKGHPQFPNSNAVFTKIMGKTAPLIVKGWLEKVGTNQYCLTLKGLHDLKLFEDVDSDIATIHVGRLQEDKLGRLLTSSAFGLSRDDRKEEITFHQFCRFAGLSARDKWQKVVGKLRSLEHLTSEAVRMGESGQNLVIHFRNRNYSFSPDNLRTLSALHTFLLERFKSQMDEWKQIALD